MIHYYKIGKETEGKPIYGLLEMDTKNMIKRERHKALGEQIDKGWTVKKITQIQAMLMKGKARPIAVEKVVKGETITCPKCGGVDGSQIYTDRWVDCPKCHGEGKIPKPI